MLESYVQRVESQDIEGIIAARLQAGGRAGGRWAGGRAGGRGGVRTLHGAEAEQRAVGTGGTTRLPSAVRMAEVNEREGTSICARCRR